MNTDAKMNGKFWKLSFHSQHIVGSEREREIVLQLIGKFPLINRWDFPTKWKIFMKRFCFASCNAYLFPEFKHQIKWNVHSNGLHTAKCTIQRHLNISSFFVKEKGKRKKFTQYIIEIHSTHSIRPHSSTTHLFWIYTVHHINCWSIFVQWASSVPS